MPLPDGWTLDEQPTLPQGWTVDDTPALSRKEQLAKGAPMSNGEASDYMAQRAAFAKEGGVKMFAKATPAETRRISYTDTGYKPNKPAKSIKEFAKNAVQDVVELPMFPVRMAADIANAPDTVEAVKETAKGLVTTPLGFVPYVSEMATGRTAAENWATNPGIGALTVLGGSELARRAAPHVADFAIDGARKSAEVTGVPKVMDAAANKLYDMTLKQGTTLKPEIRAQNLETGLDGQYLPNSKGVDKLNADIHAKEQQLGSGIAAGEAANVTGTLDRAIANVSELREQAKRSADPERNLALIDAEIERLKGNPLQAPSGEIPVGELQKMKVEQGRHVKYQQKTNQAVDPFQASIDKARIRGLRQELEVRLADAFPELADTNRQLGRMYQLQDVLERAASRIENNQGIGIGLPIKGGSGGVMGGMIGGPTGAAIGSGIGTLIGVIEHPAVAPRLALALRKAVKGLSKDDAGNIVNSRLNEIKTGMTEPPASAPPADPAEGFPPDYQPPQGPQSAAVEPAVVAEPTQSAPIAPETPEPPNIAELLENTDAQNGPVAGLSEAVDTQVFPEKWEEAPTIGPDAAARIDTLLNETSRDGVPAFTRDFVAAQYGEMVKQHGQAAADTMLETTIQRVRENNKSTQAQVAVGAKAAALRGETPADLSPSPPSPKVEAPAAHTWQSYLSTHMSRAMKETGGDHGKAMNLLGEEWRKDKSKDPLGIRASIVNKLKDERGMVGKDINAAAGLKNGRGSFGGANVRLSPREGEAEIKIVDGEAVLFADPVLVKSPELIDRQILPRAVQSFLSPLDDDVFIRVTNKKEDYTHLVNKTHKGSTNHATGDTEYGLSVAKAPEFPAKYAYLVRGKRIAHGSDGEPVIDISTAEPISGIMPFEKLRAQYDIDQARKMAEMGLGPDDVKRLHLSSYDRKGGKP